MTNDETDDLVALARRSVEVITRFQDAGGAYPASPTFPVYRYSWFRDGAFIADAMSRVGARRSAEAFFHWCAGVLTARRDQILNLVARAGTPIGRDEYLPTRYTLAGSDTGEHWWDFQIDGYGTWMWALAGHGDRWSLDLEPYRDAVLLSCQYLCAFWNTPCFDWWEEHPDDVHPSTLASVHAGIRAAMTSGLLDDPLASDAKSVCARIESFLLTDAAVDGHLVKSIGRTDVDASLIACFTPFDVFPLTSPLGGNTYARVRSDLAPDGVHRYRADTFYGGGRWLVLTGLLGWHEARTGDRPAALARLRWMHARATHDGYLPEQVTDHSLHPERIDEWIERWGTVATPLLWSHAMYLSAGVALGLWGADLGDALAGTLS